MSLSEFITRNQGTILDECEAFAQTLLPAAASMDRTALRDHASQVLAAIALDMQQPQTRVQQRQKSFGNAPRLDGDEPTAAEIHGTLRATAGFDVNQTTAEYRALRASVIRLWLESSPALGAAEVYELVRFNEAMDQALAESIVNFAEEAAHMRNVFLGVLSHELRTPLSTIVASASAMVLAEQRKLPITGAAERILRAGGRIKSLLDDLLDYVRSGLGQGMRVAPSQVDLGLVCDRVLRELLPLHPKRRIEWTRTGDLLAVCDEQRVAQAVSNLATNALKYGDADAPVDVEIDGNDDAQLIISVKNLGQPIPAETQATLFDPLVRGSGGEHAGVNLGLGLYIVKEIAEAHGGSVTVDSSRDAGTVFQMRLPRSVEPREVTAFSEIKFL